MSAPLRNPLDLGEDDGSTGGSRGKSASAAARAPTVRHGDGGTAVNAVRAPPSLSLGQPRRAANGTSSVLSLGAPRTAASSSAGGAAPPSSSAPTPDDAVRSTDSDALLSRLSAMQCGYLPRTPYAAELLAPSGPAAALQAAPPRARQTGWKVVPGASSAVPVYTSTLASASGHAPRGGSPVPPTTSAGVARRPPVINVGTYLRCTCLDARIASFARAHGGARTSQSKARGVQIVSLGAGSDDRFWRLCAGSKGENGYGSSAAGGSDAEDAEPDLARLVERYIEVDFPQLTRRKVASVARSQVLTGALIEDAQSPSAAGGAAGAGSNHLDSSTEAVLPGNGVRVDDDGTELHVDTKGYHLLALDLRDLGRSIPAGPAADSAGTSLDARSKLLAHLDPSLPTLVLFECVLSYIEPAVADRLLRWLFSVALRDCPAAEAMSYDICLGGEGGSGSSEARAVVSEFGHVMLQNLRTRRLDIPGAKAYTLPSQHRARLLRALDPAADGDDDAEAGARPAATVQGDATSLRQLWAGLSSQERDRLSRVEGLDEVEELELMLSHYCIAQASRVLQQPGEP